VRVLYEFKRWFMRFNTSLSSGIAVDVLFVEVEALRNIFSKHLPEFLTLDELLWRVHLNFENDYAPPASREDYP